MSLFTGVYFYAKFVDYNIRLEFMTVARLIHNRT